MSPILGSAIPVKQLGGPTQIRLTHDDTYDCGLFAEMVDSQTVDLFEYEGGMKLTPAIRRLVGRQINKDPFTKHRLRCIERKNFQSICTEATQFPDSSL